MRACWDEPVFVSQVCVTDLHHTWLFHGLWDLNLVLVLVQQAFIHGDISSTFLTYAFTVGFIP